MALRTILTLISGAGGVTAAEIAAGAVGTSEIADGAIGSDDFAAGSVDAAAIATGAVGSAELEDGGVAAVDLSGQVGSLYYFVVVAASVANITMGGSAPSVLDGINLSANDDVLCKDQTTGSENGPYNVDTLGTGANGTWTRMTERDAAAELPIGCLCYVKGGTVNGQKMYRLSTFAGTLGTDSQTWEEVEEGLTPTAAGEPEAVGTGDGATLNFDLDSANVAAIAVFVDGILQAASTYAIAAGAGAGGVDQLQFGSGNAPANGLAVEAIVFVRS